MENVRVLASVWVGLALIATLVADEMIVLWADWMKKYPIFSSEDGLAEYDWARWKKPTARLGNQAQLVGDDIFVTNPEIFAKRIKEGVANSILLKLNQIGTVTETLRGIELARKNKYTYVVSHRYGETDDTTIADFTWTIPDQARHLCTVAVGVSVELALNPAERSPADQEGTIRRDLVALENT